jgi:hypothetical protein
MPGQWSPGPWRSDGPDVFDVNGNLVADCWGTDDDAELLAAARELYEALAEIRDAIKAGGVSSEMLNKADCALAKANFWDLGLAPE